MREHLGRINFSERTPIDIYREDNRDVVFSQDGHDIVLRKAPGLVTIEIAAMLESVGGKWEDPDG